MYECSGVTHVNEVLPAAHMFNTQVEGVIPAFTSQPQSITALWPVHISHTAEDRRLS